MLGKTPSTRALRWPPNPSRRETGLRDLTEREKVLAEKAIEGSAQSKALSGIQKALVDQGRKSSSEKA